MVQALTPGLYMVGSFFYFLQVLLPKCAAGGLWGSRDSRGSAPGVPMLHWALAGEILLLFSALVHQKGFTKAHAGIGFIAKPKHSITNGISFMVQSKQDR
jgi:hypothetical protein